MLQCMDTEIVEFTPETQLKEEYSEHIQRALMHIHMTHPHRDPPPDHPRGPNPTLHAPPDPAASTGEGGGAVASTKVKLPKIPLPHFKVNPIYWTAFWDSYESVVHLSSALSDVYKFNYLRSLLEKLAYDAIAYLHPTTMKQLRY